MGDRRVALFAGCGGTDQEGGADLAALLVILLAGDFRSLPVKGPVGVPDDDELLLLARGIEGWNGTFEVGGATISWLASGTPAADADTRRIDTPYLLGWNGANWSRLPDDVVPKCGRRPGRSPLRPWLSAICPPSGASAASKRRSSICGESVLETMPVSTFIHTTTKPPSLVGATEGSRSLKSSAPTGRPHEQLKAAVCANVVGRCPTPLL
ncbi:MAG TPA: hypothetical protein VGS57_10440 [Thermoanaerobaculia bacterium]|nr:hypothetical protein [Thermoanaerobaculia bacterium]